MNIYVGNISWGLSDQDLENVFAEYGTVTSAKIITDRMTNRSRGFGFVEMSDGAEAAIEALNGTEVDGRELVVNESRPKDNLLSLMVLLPLSTFVYAQDDADEEEVEEVVTTGIKSSLIDAIDIKRKKRWCG
jgi:RNA recognition motif-containing protein